MTHKTSAAAVGVDVGGTKIAAGIITPAGEVLLPRTVPTPVSQGPQAVLQAIIEQVADLLKVLPEQNGSGFYRWARRRTRRWRAPTAASAARSCHAHGA